MFNEINQSNSKTSIFPTPSINIIGVGTENTKFQTFIEEKSEVVLSEVGNITEMTICKYTNNKIKLLKRALNIKILPYATAEKYIVIKI